MGVEGVFSALAAGLVIGLLGKLVVPGRQAIPLWLTVVVGVVAAFLGTAAARLFGVEETPGPDWVEIGLQVLISALGVGLAAGFYGKKPVR